MAQILVRNLGERVGNGSRVLVQLNGTSCLGRRRPLSKSSLFRQSQAPQAGKQSFRCRPVHILMQSVILTDGEARADAKH